MGGGVTHLSGTSNAHLSGTSNAHGLHTRKLGVHEDTLGRSTLPMGFIHGIGGSLAGLTVAPLELQHRTQ